MNKLVTVIGTRPEFTKMAALIPHLDKHFDHILIHTGQHFSLNMDKVFFDELSIRKPDFFLYSHSKSNASQVGKILSNLEPLLLDIKPDAVLTYADTNSMLGGSLVAVKNNLPLVHLESGCRTFLRNQPEEVNRVIADSISGLLLTSDQSGIDNLKKEGITSTNFADTKREVVLVGRTCYEVIKINVPKANHKVLAKYNLETKTYLLATIHRAANTDNSTNFHSVIKALNEISSVMEVVFPIHPRTKKVLIKTGIKLNKNIKLIPPQGYFDFLGLLVNCYLVVTDSGGIQEEGAILNVPVLIAKNETEWQELVSVGKNKLITNNADKLVSEVKKLLKDRKTYNQMVTAKYDWVQNTNSLIVKAIKNYLS